MPAAAEYRKLIFHFEVSALLQEAVEEVCYGFARMTTSAIQPMLQTQ
jgi:hypothetical protein